MSHTDRLSDLLFSLPALLINFLKHLISLSHLYRVFVVAILSGSKSVVTATSWYIITFSRLRYPHIKKNQDVREVNNKNSYKVSFGSRIKLPCVDTNISSNHLASKVIPSVGLSCLYLCICQDSMEWTIAVPQCIALGMLFHFWTFGYRLQFRTAREKQQKLFISVSSFCRVQSFEAYN